MADTEYYVYADGIVSADTSQILVNVQNDWLAVFGQNLSTDPSTPQGRIMELTAAAEKFHVTLGALIANQINPNYATGQYLDALCAIFGIERTPATSTMVYANISGVPGTVIPQGFAVATTAGDEFQTKADVTIDNSGSVSQVAFYSVEAGAIPCAPGTLTKIVAPMPGVESVNNPSAPEAVGTEIESDAELRPRMLGSRFTREALPDAIKSAVNTITGVISYWFYNNGEDTPVYVTPQDMIIHVDGDGVVTSTDAKDGTRTIFEDNGKVTVIAPDGTKTVYEADDPDKPTAPTITPDDVKVLPHSIILVIEGGDPDAIAQALFTTRSAGCNFTSLPGAGLAQTKVVLSDAGAFNVAYDVIFNRPEKVAVDCNVTVQRKSYTGTDTALTAEIKAAIADWLSGNVAKVDKPGIGGTVYTYEVGAAVSEQIPQIAIQEVKIALHGETPGSAAIGVNKAQMVSIAADDITIVING